MRGTKVPANVAPSSPARQFLLSFLQRRRLAQRHANRPRYSPQRAILSYKSRWAPRDRPLPDAWQEAIPHLCLIFRVARKILSQEPFLIEQPPDQDGQYEENGEEPP